MRFISNVDATKVLCKCNVYFSDSWTVHATMDPVFCNAFVDFNVPGKPDPPPSKLTATIWKQSHVLPTGTTEKNAIEFTDPSGKLAPPSVPLNTWVQADSAVTESAPGPIPKNCLEGSPIVFKDMSDGASKLVTLDGDYLTVVPFNSNAR